jgi:type 1 glutamine amidotransferase
MRRIAIVLSLFAVAAAAVGSASLLPNKVAAPKAAKKKLLVVTHTGGFRHDSIAVAESTIKEIGDKSGLFDVEYCRTRDDVQKMITADGLKGFDGVFFANTTTNPDSNMGIPDMKAFLDWIKAGHGFMGAHSATDTYKPGDKDSDGSYSEMIGGAFLTHHAQCEIEPKVEDRKHPATAHLGATWKVFDEIYLFRKNERANVHVLLACDKHPNDGSKEANQPGDYLIAWNKMYGKGKVFYTELGHRKEMWADETYRQHVLGGIRWALGLAKGDSKLGTGP